MAVVDGERSCYVASFKDDVTEDLIEELFTQVGPVSRVLMKTLPKNDQRYALVEFEDEESVIFAIETLDGIKLFDQSLTVKPRNGTNQEEIWKKARGAIDRRQRSNPVPQPNTSSHRTSHQNQQQQQQQQRAAPQPYAIPDRNRTRSQYQQYSTPQSSYQHSSQNYHHQQSAPTNYHHQAGHSNSYHQQSQEYTPRRSHQNQQNYNSGSGNGRNYEDRRQSGGGPDRNYSNQRYSTPRNQGNWR